MLNSSHCGTRTFLQLHVLLFNCSIYLQQIRMHTNCPAVFTVDQLGSLHNEC